jgi:hypothetical protein
VDMEKVKKPRKFGRSYRPVVIWLEDLTEIVSTLKESAKEVHISTEDYLFKTVEEFKEHFGSQPQFDAEIMTIGGPYVRIEFGRMWVRVHIGPGPQSAQQFHDIDAILTRRQRSIFYSWWWLVPLLLAAVAAHVFPDQAGAIVVAQSVIGSWYLWVLFVGLRRSVVINLQRRSEARPFLQRNGDQLMLMLISAAVGGLITFAGVAVKERFYPSTPIPTNTAPKQP